AAKSQNLAFELGAAMSWRKPVYLLLEGLKPNELFAAAHKFHMSPMKDLPRVVESIRNSRRPFSEQDRTSLKRAYEQIGLSADRLLAEPASLDSLSRRFEALSGERVAAERLAGEL